MKTIRDSNPSTRCGSAVLITFVLLAAISVILLANAATLRWLKVEIQRVEQQQEKRHGPRPGH